MRSYLGWAGPIWVGYFAGVTLVWVLWLSGCAGQGIALSVSAPLPVIVAEPKP